MEACGAVWKLPSLSQHPSVVKVFTIDPTLGRPHKKKGHPGLCQHLIQPIGEILPPPLTAFPIGMSRWIVACKGPKAFGAILILGSEDALPEISSGTGRLQKDTTAILTFPNRPQPRWCLTFTRCSATRLACLAWLVHPYLVCLRTTTGYPPGRKARPQGVHNRPQPGEALDTQLRCLG